MTPILRRVAGSVRKALSFTAPALVLGLVVMSQAYARINYPPPPAGTLERNIDNILLKERADILRQSALITRQNVTFARIGVLQRQIAQATDPAVIARLQRQLLQQQVQFQGLQVQIDRNSVVLLTNLNVLNPQKDRMFVVLNSLQTPRNQIVQFIQAASLQQRTYAAIMRAFLARRPLSPTAAF